VGELVAAIIKGVGAVALAFIKGIFGTDKPRAQTVKRPDPEVEVSDGKTDKEKLRDLGL
jgi:hypothetical protein